MGISLSFQNRIRYILYRWQWCWWGAWACGWCWARSACPSCCSRSSGATAGICRTGQVLIYFIWQVFFVNLSYAVSLTFERNGDDRFGSDAMNLNRNILVHIFLSEVGDSLNNPTLYASFAYKITQLSTCCVHLPTQHFNEDMWVSISCRKHTWIAALTDLPQELLCMSVINHIVNHY